MTENMIHRQKSVRDLNNDQIANLMTAAGQKVSGDMVQKIFAGSAGLTLEKIDAFLGTLGLKVVASESVVITSEKYDALCLFAKEALDRMGGKAGE